jgi:hypothetical protein
VSVEELLVYAVQQYIDRLAEDLPELDGVTVQRLVNEPDVECERELFVVSIPFNGYKIYDLINDEDLRNSRLNLVGWIEKLKFRSCMIENQCFNGFHFVDEDNYLESIIESEWHEHEEGHTLFCAGAQIPWHQMPF